MKTRINGLPKNTKIFIWQPRWNMISPVIFAGALTIFAGPCPRGPTLVTGLIRSLAAAADETLHADQKSTCVAVAM